MTASRLIRPRRVVVALAAVLAAGASQAAGLDIHAQPTAADIGLPLYPGAVSKEQMDNGPGGFSFGVWGDSFGFKLAVATFRSDDAPEAVARFYREALGRVGPVLDCTHHRRKADGTPAAAPMNDLQKKADREKPVNCDDDEVEPGAYLYKVGTQAEQRVFKASPMQGGSSFELVRISGHLPD